jgi:hypothetical protein
MPISYVPYTIKLTAESTIFQNEVKCTLLENDFNFSQNPTVFANTTYLTGSAAAPFYGPVGGLRINGQIIDGTLANNVTGSSFNPYTTTVGLYNEQNELLVVGKLATPYPIPDNTDMTFIVKWDS